MRPSGITMQRVAFFVYSEALQETRILIQLIVDIIPCIWNLHQVRILQLNRLVKPQRTHVARLLFMIAFSPQNYIGLYKHFPWNILHFKAEQTMGKKGKNEGER